MTRTESDAARKAANRKDYLRRREKILAYQRQYAKDNREHINAMQRERRRRKAIGSCVAKKEYVRPSTDDFESELPLLLKVNLQRLRDEYLSIPIHQRPIYDYWLRCKTIEYYRAIILEKRKYDHPDIILPKELS
jgi:hypothetical protein